MISRYLTHYFSQVYTAAGMRWDSDNDGEMKELEAEIMRLTHANDSQISKLKQQVEYLIAKVEALESAK